VQIEERTLRLVNGDAYSRDALQKQTLDELRELLGTWGWPQNSFSICQTWYELDWFLQPAEGPDYILMFPLRPKTGDPSQTPIDWALCGAQSSPRDNSGAPIIRYCGSKHDDCFGYNPPDVVASIHAVLSTIDDQAWNDLVPQRIDQYQRANSEWGDNLAAVVSNELENARIAFAEMRQAYHAAQEQGFGIACEYSL
jgi:hypothetical protein